VESELDAERVVSEEPQGGADQAEAPGESDLESDGPVDDNGGGDGDGDGEDDTMTMCTSTVTRNVIIVACSACPNRVWTIFPERVLEVGGHTFTTVMKADITFIRYVSGRRVWNHHHSSLLDELVEYATAASKMAVGSVALSSSSGPQSDWERRKVALKLKRLTLERQGAQAVASVHLKEFWVGDVHVHGVDTYMPLHLHGKTDAKIELKESVISWVWMRFKCLQQRVSRPIRRRAENPPLTGDNVFWHRTKRAYIAHPCVKGSEWKRFRPVDESVTSISAAANDARQFRSA
jgi:hypothetical protein